MDGMRHEEYFISYEDKDSYWDQMYAYATGHDDLDYYVRWAEKMRDYGHRNVRVMESVVVEREVTVPEMHQLKPCPFCGGEARLVRNKRYTLDRSVRSYWSVLHVCPNRTYIDTGYCETKTEAAEKWNRRS